MREQSARITDLERENERLREQLAAAGELGPMPMLGDEGHEDAWLDAHMEDVLSGGYDSWGG